MQKVTGIKSVDIKITAEGHGVVNWNGSTTLSNDGKNVDNHMLPKLRGFSPLSGRVKEENGYKYKKDVNDIDFKKTPLYISQNCLRHHLFRDQGYDMHYADKKNLDQLIASVTGLLRGFVVPATQNKKTSPLLLTDFIDQLGNGNFEQYSTDKPLNEKEAKDKKNESDSAYARGSDTLYSKTTFGDTRYIGYASISIEELQFISLDPKFDRCAKVIKEGEGEEIATKITDFLNSIKQDESLQPKATFHKNYCRLGTIFKEGEAGVLLDNDAIKILVDEMLSRLAELAIKQAKGYMFVTDIEVDYNDSTHGMRIKYSPNSIETELEEDFAVYYQGI